MKGFMIAAIQKWGEKSWKRKLHLTKKPPEIRPNMIVSFNCQLKYIQLSTQTCINVSNRTVDEYTLCALKQIHWDTPKSPLFRCAEHTQHKTFVLTKSRFWWQHTWDGASPEMLTFTTAQLLSLRVGLKISFPLSVDTQRDLSFT